jgi:hypothetical protein
MNYRTQRKHTLGSLLAAYLVGGCAIPATEVAVSTESMHDALQQARAAHRSEPANEVPLRRPVRSPAPPGAPQPILAPPDVRMAYLYEWVDAEGNKHFGGWVAIPLAGFDWVMDDGSNPPLSAPPSESPGSGTPR